MPRHQDWNRADDQALRELYGTMVVKDIVPLLGRSVDAIARRATQLKLKRFRKAPTAAALEAMVRQGMTDQQIAIHEGCTRCHISALRRALNLPFNRLPPAIHAVREALREEKLDRMTRRRPAPLPAAPTWANPGTEAKVVVMEARFTKRVQLFHPDDACYSSRRI